MLKNLKEGLDRVNELFGTSIGVELNDEVFYAGSANATLGEDAEEPEEPEDVIEEDANSAAVDNENGDEETTEDKKSEDEETKEGEE